MPAEAGVPWSARPRIHGVPHAEQVHNLGSVTYAGCRAHCVPPTTLVWRMRATTIGTLSRPSSWTPLVCAAVRAVPTSSTLARLGCSVEGRLWRQADSFRVSVAKSLFLSLGFKRLEKFVPFRKTDDHCSLCTCRTRVHSKDKQSGPEKQSEASRSPDGPVQLAKG